MSSYHVPGSTWNTGIKIVNRKKPQILTFYETSILVGKANNK